MKGHVLQGGGQLSSHLRPAPRQAASKASGNGQLGPDQDEDVCIVCMDSQRNAYFAPCTCRVACFPCALKVAAMNQTCPWCGQSINGAFKAEHGN